MYIVESSSVISARNWNQTSSTGVSYRQSCRALDAVENRRAKLRASFTLLKTRFCASARIHGYVAGSIYSFSKLHVRCSSVDSGEHGVSQERVHARPNAAFLADVDSVPAAATTAGAAVGVTGENLGQTEVSRESNTASPGMEQVEQVSLVMESTAELLEFGRVLECLSSLALTQTGRQRLLSRGLMIHLLSLTKQQSERLMQLTAEVVTIERRTPTSPFEVLKRLPDVEGLIQRLHKKGNLEGEELLRIANFVQVAANLKKASAECLMDSSSASPDAYMSSPAFDSTSCTNQMHTEPLAVQKCSAELQSILDRVQPVSAAASEIFATLDETGRPRETASDELRVVRTQLQRIKERIKDELQRIIQSKGDALQDRTPTTRYDRQVLAVKATHKRRIPGIVHDYSNTGSTVFVEPHAIVELNSELRRLSRRESAIERDIWNQLSKRLHAASVRLSSTFEALIDIDFSVARARYARHIGASLVRFAADSEMPVDIRGACHPLLLWRSLKSMESVVPIDFHLRGIASAAILTGANAGGKTLAAKTLGLIVLMAKSGIPIPRRHADPNMSPTTLLDEDVTVPYFDRVLADIGDEQSLEQNLSTFSGHIRRIGEILQCATADSLVLLDELGAGTDPAEGAALGIALVRYLVEKKNVRFVFVTTHHSELKTLFFMEPARYENVSVEFDTDRLEPTYRLLWGVAGRSYALLVARRLGLDHDILQEAENLLERSVGVGSSPDSLPLSPGSGSSSPQNMSRLMEQVEKIRVEQLQNLERARQEAREMERMRQEHEKRLAGLERHRKEAIEEVKRALEAELEQVRQELREALQRLRRNEMASSGGNTLANTLEAKVAEATMALAGLERDDDREINPETVDTNDYVMVPKLGSSPLRVTQKLPDGRIRVALGNLTATIAVQEVVSVQRPTEASTTMATERSPRRRVEAEKPASGLSSPVLVRTDRNTVDLRGMRAHEVESALDSAIDRSVQMGSLWIIHGHGSGRLKSVVREYLRGHPHVDSFQEASPSDGGSGVTVAVLR
jgi:DNA mismatch repair protein MutS2